MMPLELLYGLVSIVFTVLFCFVAVRTMPVLIGVFVGGLITAMLLFAVHYGLVLIIGG